MQLVAIPEMVLKCSVCIFKNDIGMGHPHFLVNKYSIGNIALFKHKDK